MSHSFAPPLQAALKPDRILPRAILLAAAGFAFAMLAYAWVYSDVWVVLVLALSSALAWFALYWQLKHHTPAWAWLGQDGSGQWWLATESGLRHEQRLDITLDPDSRYGRWGLVLVYGRVGARANQVLWLPGWRLHPDDFRRLRVRLRWPPVTVRKPAWGARIRDGWAKVLAILGAPRNPGVTKMGVTRMAANHAMPSVEHLLHPDPAHIYSEDELDAIEAVDPELALRLDRAQTFAERQAADQPATGPIDEDQVRQAITEARRILQQDGGDIEFIAVEERTVKVRLKGACVGCPRATLDLRNVVERLVKARAPGVERVANTF